MRPQLRSKTVLLGLTGSIALYKSCDLVRRLKDAGADVHCLMTRGAEQFVSPLTFSALSGNPVATGVWDEKLWRMAHLELAEKSDLLIVAPASAQALARLAAGFADDALGATALATASPILIAPAMHEGMWKSPATQANVRRLKEYGMRFIGPARGPLASGRPGMGRMADVSEIVSEAARILGRAR